MESLKTAITFILLVSVIHSSFANKWRVNNTLTAPEEVDFEELKDAIESSMVVSGDTIYVEGSATPYEGQIESFKRLTIIGPGYLLGQGHLQPTVCSFLPATIGDRPGITLREGSEGTFITGMEFTTNFTFPESIILQNTANIIITRNRLETIQFENGNSNSPNTCSDIVITRNLICQDIIFGCPIEVNGIWIGNNLIGDDIASSCTFTDEIHIENGIVEYNTFEGSTNNDLWIKGSSIRFNMVGEICALPNENIMINNNRLGNNSTKNNNIIGVDDSNFVDDYDFSEWDCDTDDWRSQPIDLVHGAHNGLNAIYGNQTADQPNLPAWPVISECEVASCADTTLQVQFTIRTNQ